jgi:ADP-ribose pyrophosphatase
MIWKIMDNSHGRFTDDERLIWRERGSRELLSNPIFDVRVSHRTSRSGAAGDFYLLHARDWVNVVPVIRDPSGEDRFLMVRQYRHGMGGITLEFPAGILEPGEDPLAAARRELEEETGRGAGRITLLGKVSPNPAFMDNWCWTYLAENLSPPGKSRLDDTEVLDVHEVPVREVMEGVGKGELVNSLVMVALLWYIRRGPVTI